MNLKDAFDTAVILNSKIQSKKFSSDIQNKKKLGDTSAQEYIDFFEEMNFSERKFLREIGKYSILLEGYDTLKSGQPLPAFAFQHIIVALQSINLYIQANVAYFPASDARVYTPDDAVEIRFPLVALKSTTFEFVEEVDWFFKIFNRVSEELSESDKRPEIRSVDNADVSIAVSVDWKFLIAIMLLWHQIQSNDSTIRKIREALAVLRQIGLNDEEADAMETKLSSTDEAAIDAAKGEYLEMTSEHEAGWENSFTALGRLLAAARDKGYHLGFMRKEQNPNEFLLTGKWSSLTRVRELIYSREDDKPSSAKQQLISED